MTGSDCVPPRTAAGGASVTRFAARDSHRLSFESSGIAPGVPVLALHDLLADRGQLRPLRAAVAPRIYRLTLPDARGHGASASISGAAYSPRELAADALAILDMEGEAAAHVVTIGWGAVIALALAAAAPERVLSLILVEPYLPHVLGHHPESRVRQDAAAHLEVLREATIAAKKGQTDRALDLFLGARFGAGWRDALTKQQLGVARRAAANLGPLLSGMGAAAVDREALRGVQMPVMVLLRAETSLLERQGAEALAALLPDRVREETISPGFDPTAIWAEVARALASLTR